MADSEESGDNVSQETSLNASHDQQEAIDEMLARHRKEIKELQNKETEMKKAAAKGSKAEQKAKKKQVEEDISKQSAKLKEKQLKELASQGFSSSSNETKEKKEGDIDTLVRAIAGVSVTSQQEHSNKPSKSVKRREKRAQQEAEREQRIQEEQSKVISDRFVENEKLEKKLQPMGLTISEIKPDGHCLYRAVENQLAHLFSGASPYNYQKLREMAAAYMRDHIDDFLPFFLSENDAESESNCSGSAEERFEKYCREVESTAAWGGQLELGALTHCLRKHIMVFSGSFPDVEMGKEYKSGDGFDSSVKLSYHKHAFGLGEHYNSVLLVRNVTG